MAVGTGECERRVVSETLDPTEVVRFVNDLQVARGGLIIRTHSVEELRDMVVRVNQSQVLADKKYVQSINEGELTYDIRRIN